jgi:hypothetical protein
LLNLKLFHSFYNFKKLAFDYQNTGFKRLLKIFGDGYEGEQQKETEQENSESKTLQYQKIEMDIHVGINFRESEYVIFLFKAAHALRDKMAPRNYLYYSGFYENCDEMVKTNSNQPQLTEINNLQNDKPKEAHE